MLGMTRASTTITRREAARQKTTGRFGEQVRSSPEVALALDSISHDELDAAQARRDAAAETRREVTDVLRAIEGGVGSFASKRNQWRNFDDIVGDTVIQIFTQHARGTSKLAPALGVHIAQRVGVTYLYPDEHHTTRTARQKLNAWFDDFIQEHGRIPSGNERAAKAEEIRLAMPAGQRATAGFEDRRAFVSLEAPGEGGEDGEIWFGDSIPDNRPGNDYALSQTRAAAANDALELGGTFRAADARKNIWNILADDGPQVAVKTIEDDRAHRAAVEEAGGAAAVARAWATGETEEDHPATAALFAPFGSISQEQRGEVSDILTRNAAYADKIWDSAMTAALDVQRLRAIKRRESRQAGALRAA
mgnify:FL=1